MWEFCKFAIICKDVLSMGYCRNCGVLLPENSRFCPSCGCAVSNNGVPVGTPPDRGHYSPDSDLESPISVLGYVGIHILLAIPVANIVALIVWSFGYSQKKNLTNMARAILLIYAVVLGLCLIIFLVALSLGEL